MTLFVAGLPLDMDDKELKAIFADHGEVISAKIIKDRMNGYSRGFGFVAMAEEIDALGAIKALHRATIEGKEITVRAAEYKPRSAASTIALSSSRSNTPQNRLV
jgi:cold-inducible RNA-binding protein